jgi:hypothetical protein
MMRVRGGRKKIKGKVRECQQRNGEIRREMVWPRKECIEPLARTYNQKMNRLFDAIGE